MIPNRLIAMERIPVSAYLTGYLVRYDGRNKLCQVETLWR
jgi:uncharacterized protein YbbK (DUF523 family)